MSDQARGSGPAGERRLLVVDDDADFLRTVQILLEDETDCAVETALSGAEALARLAAREAAAVLTDLSMPGMDGIALLRRIRDERPHLPVLMMTAYAAGPAEEEARAAGAAAFLRKPIDPDELLRAVAVALGPCGESA